MKKITELKETRLRTVYTRNDSGDLERDAEEWIFTRQVKTVSPGRRFAHYLIDSFVLQIFIALMGLIAQAFAPAVADYNYNIFVLISMFNYPSILAMFVIYYFGFEIAFQKTPGKFITGCSVIDEYGQRPDFKAILARSLVRLVPFEALSCLGDKHSYGWHDKWSNTWVVTDDELLQLQILQDENDKGIADVHTASGVIN